MDGDKKNKKQGSDNWSRIRGSHGGWNSTMTFILPVPQTFLNQTSPKHTHVLRITDRKAAFHYVLHWGCEVLAIYFLTRCATLRDFNSPHIIVCNGKIVTVCTALGCHTDPMRWCIYNIERHLFIDSPNTYLLNTYCVTSTRLHSKNIFMNKTDKDSFPGIVSSFCE